MTDNTVPHDDQPALTVAQIIAQDKLMIDRNALPHPGDEGELVYVDPRTLHIDHGNYQRETNLKHATTIGQNFKYEYSKAVSAYRCPTTGRLFVTDGQHTSIGAALAGVARIPVLVFNLQQQVSSKVLIKRQSKQFVAINKNVKKMDRYTLHRNELIQEEPLAVEVQELCDKTGVVLIPTSQKKKRTPGSMSHVDVVYKSVTQIGSKAAEMGFRFHRKFWPREPIEPVVFWGLARFFKQFEAYRARGIAGAQFDETLIYKALTEDGLRMLKDVPDFLETYFAQTGAVNANNGDIWRAKAIRMAYNDYVDDLKLGADKRLDARIY